MLRVVSYRPFLSFKVRYSFLDIIRLLKNKEEKYGRKKEDTKWEQSPKNMIKKALSLPTMGSKKARVAILTAVAGGSLLIGYWGGSAANNQNTSTIATFNSGVVTNKALYSYLKR